MSTPIPSLRNWHGISGTSALASISQDVARSYGVSPTVWAITNQTKAIVASQAALIKTFGSAFDQLNGSISLGFDKVSNEIGNLSAMFDHRMGLMAEQLSIQGRKLDDIAAILRSPTATSAREHVSNGLGLYARSLIQEAVEEFKDALDVYKSDYISNYYLGIVFLYDRSAYDLEAATEHLRSAVRYAEHPEEGDGQSTSYLAKANFHLGVALAVAATNSRDASAMNEAARCAKDALAAQPGFGDALYFLSKIHASNGQIEDSMSYLRHAIESDKVFAVRVSVDEDMTPVRDAVNTLLESMRDTALAEAERKVQRANSLLDNVNKSPGLSAAHGKKEPIALISRLYFDVLWALDDAGNVIVEYEKYDNCADVLVSLSGSVPDGIKVGLSIDGKPCEYLYSGSTNVGSDGTQTVTITVKCGKYDLLSRVNAREWGYVCPIELAAGQVVNVLIKYETCEIVVKDYGDYAKKSFVFKSLVSVDGERIYRSVGDDVMALSAAYPIMNINLFLYALAYGTIFSTIGYLIWAAKSSLLFGYMIVGYLLAIIWLIIFVTYYVRRRATIRRLNRFLVPE